MTFNLRKIITLLISAAVLIITGSITVFAGNVLSEAVSSDTEYILGDADCDGQVTINDATCIQKAIALYKLSGDYSESAADVDGNGVVGINDVTYVQLWLANIQTPYQIGEKFAVQVEPTTQKPTGIDTDDEGWGREIFQP